MNNKRNIKQRLTALLLYVFSSSLFAQAEDGKLKVFILAGQSNMEGFGMVVYKDWLTDSTGTLPWLLDSPDHRSDFEHLVDEDGELITRDDVWVYYDRSRGGEPTHMGPLNWATGVIDSVGHSGELYIGPEAGIGWKLGDFYQDQVLLIKTCWGGRSLAKDFLPPSAGGPGSYYTKMVNDVNLVLSDIKKFFPDYNDQGYEIAGFQWNQGYSDKDDPEYEDNLVNFIKDVRKEFKVPELPFVIGETGNSYAMGGKRNALSLAQEAAADPDKHPEFEGNVAFAPTNQFADRDLAPDDGGYLHWAFSFYSYFKVGEAMGQAMVGLLDDGKTPVAP